MFCLLQPLGLGQAVRELIQAHPYAALVVMVLAAFAVFNAAVQALEKPTERSGPGYRYLYRFSHLLAFNFQHALRAKFPEYVPENCAKVEAPDDWPPPPAAGATA